ncbi:hypothetical protein GALMADRAFT_234064 [Galerina marginata CBS 339.88]|uniref:Las1-domain-containing protein n=1 Tax=Galerina marginata (strain CBS 339.88) TaxID=685588 RepID=A0A067TPZ0_GALM3|nr:hypothetical protein GALMADRAFT_234064 [Galerina marginata CBS 339.88]
MRLPKRVPWSSLVELEQICASIYAEENDIDSKISAINRISAWKAITPLPHALDSALALLVAVVHDKKQISVTTLQLRHSYAMAVLRLVNGLVDPLQVGTYARSITSIAQQLGIPNWLVELRHASTHEDLPSLDLLREAARQSLSWLLYNYFLPTINPISGTQQVTNPFRPLKPILKLYKNTMKAITRDASLVPQYKPKLVNILRDLERWIAETKVASNILVGEIDWTPPRSFEADADTKEIWALERFCDGLAETGMLVPLSKKKRQYSDDVFLPSPTSIAFWNPVFKQVQAIHPEFSYVFVSRFALVLLGTTSPNAPLQTSEAHKRDPSYDGYLACWIIWVIENWKDNLPVYFNLKKHVLSILMRGLGYDSSTLSSRSAVLALLKKLCAGHEGFEPMIALVFMSHFQAVGTWDSRDLDVMKVRNDILQSHRGTTVDIMAPVGGSTSKEATSTISIPGWSRLEANHWKTCPIGVYHVR